MLRITSDESWNQKSDEMVPGSDQYTTMTPFEDSDVALAARSGTGIQDQIIDGKNE